MAKPVLNPCSVTLLLLALSAAGCSQTSHVIAPPPEPPRIPALPSQARQPAMPSICSPTCSLGLTLRRESWRKRLTWPVPQESPANGPTTP